MEATVSTTIGQDSDYIRDHPFTRELFDVPYRTLLYILSDMETNESQENLLPSELEEWIKNLNLFGTSIFVRDETSDEVRPFHRGADKAKLANVIVKKQAKREVVENEDLKYSRRNIVEEVVEVGAGTVDIIKPSFRLEIVHDETEYHRYQVSRNAFEIVLYISANAPSMKRHITYDPDTKQYVGLRTEAAYEAITNIAMDAFAEELTMTQLAEEDGVANEYYIESKRKEKANYEALEPQVYGAIFAWMDAMGISASAKTTDTNIAEDFDHGNT